MNPEEMAAAFNEWMREFTEDPRAFEAEFQTVAKFYAETFDDDGPSYGAQCAALLQRYHEKLRNR